MTTDQLKMLFGFTLLAVTAGLAAMIAMGEVRQETSHGLSEIIGGLLALCGGFAQWAFGGSSKP